MDHLTTPAPQKQWELISARLPEKHDDEWYTPKELSRLVGISHKQVAAHCHDLWPRHEGWWRLSREEAVRVIRRVCLVGRKLPSSDESLAARNTLAA